MEKFLADKVREEAEQLELSDNPLLFMAYLKLIYGQYGQCAMKVFERFDKDERVRVLEKRKPKRQTLDELWRYPWDYIFLVTVSINYMYACDKYGQDEAEMLLDDFFNGKELFEWAILWVFGIEVRETLRLKSGCEIRSVEEVPDCFVKRQILLKRKESYQSNRSYYPPYMNGALPQSAIVQRIEEDSDVDLVRFLTGQERHSGAVYKNLTIDSCILFNFIEGISCWPITHSIKVEQGKRFSNIRLNGCIEDGTRWYYNDIYCGQPAVLTSSKVEQIDMLQENFFHRDNKEKEILERAAWYLSRARYAMGLTDSEDRVINLAIALEMLLAKKGDKLRGTELAKRAQRILKGKSKVNEEVMEIYQCRNEAVHEGRMKEEKRSLADKNHSGWCDLVGRLGAACVNQGMEFRQ